MHFVSRSLKITAGALLVLLLIAVTGWFARHAWIPGAVNSQLDGMRLTEFQGLNLSRTDRGLSADIAHMRLVTDNQLTIDLSNIHVSRIPSLLRRLLSFNAQAHSASEISIERLDLDSPEDAAVDATDVNEPKVALQDSEVSPHPREKTARTISDDKNGLSITDTLDGLRQFPVRKLQIRHIRWPDEMDDELSFSATKSTATAINGELRSDQCASCRLELDIESEKSLARLNLKLHHDNKPVAQLNTRLHAMDPTGSEHLKNEWHISGNLSLAAAQLPSLLKRIGISSETSGDWVAIAQSMQGTLALKMNAEVPDRIAGSNDLRNINATINTQALSLVLPETLAGLPLATEFTTAQPINLQIHSVVPVSVATIDGALQIRTAIQTETGVTRDALPLLLSNFELTTKGGAPNIVFQGQTLLEDASKIWNTQKWQHLRKHIPVTEIQGTLSFTGVFALPGLDGLLASPETLHIHQFLMDIRQENDTEIQLEVAKDKNPLAALNWKKLQMRLRGGESIKVSSPRLPGNVDLEIPQLSLAANEISRLRGKKGLPDLQTELSNLHCKDLPNINCTLKLKAEMRELNLPDATTSVKNINVALTETKVVTAKTGTVSIELRELNLTADQALTGEISLGKPELFIQQAKCQFQNGELACESPQAALNLDPLSNGDNQLRGVVFLEDLSATYHGDKGKGLLAKSRFHAEGLNIRAMKQYKADVTARGQWQIANQEITGNGDITTGPLALNTSWQHNLTNAQGSLTLNVPKAEFAPKNPLSRALQGLPVDIVGGSVQAEASLHWPLPGKNQLKLTLTDTAFQYNDSFAVGVNGRAALRQQADKWITTAPVPVSVDSVDAGVAINNLHFVLSLADNGDLTLGNFSAVLLEGALTADNLNWNLNGEERKSRLQFTGISIGALAKEMESTNFAASGLLDASIPITTERQGITVDNGTVQSRSPGGRLRYYGAFSASMLGSNPQLKLLAGALEDYNYRDISGTMTYPLSGDLKLNLKLTGRSAAIDANRDLIINLNLENNVPSMLRSLQASRDLTDVLERQVQ